MVRLAQQADGEEPLPALRALALLRSEGAEVRLAPLLEATLPADTAPLAALPASALASLWLARCVGHESRALFVGAPVLGEHGLLLEEPPQ